MVISRFFSVLTILIFIASSRSDYAPSDVPNPMLNPAACGRPDVPRSAICDPAMLLNKESKDVIEGYINAAVGVQISVVVIDEMRSNYVGTDEIEIASERFARTLHNSWGVGDKLTNNGVLIFLSVNDRSVYISTGVGVQRKLTRQYIDYLVTEMRPDLRKKEYGTALGKTVVQIDLIISDKSNIAERYKESTKTDPYFVGFLVLTFCGVFGVMVFENRKLIQLKKGQQVLDNFMSEINEASENKNFKSESCPICLEVFSTPSSKSPSPDSNDALEGGGQRSERGSGGSVEMNHPYSTLSASHEDDTDELVLRKKEKENDRENDKERFYIQGTLGPKERERDESPMRPMALHCGHVYCYECLSAFLKTRDGTKCPICRAPVSGEAPPPPPPTQPRPPGSGGDGNNRGGGSRGGRCCADTFNSQETDIHNIPTQRQGQRQGQGQTNTYYSDTTQTDTTYYNENQNAEYMYRIQRMNYLYPRVMTTNTMITLNTALSYGTAAEFRRAASVRSAEVNRTITDIETRNAASQSGSRGSSYGSFGGGSSGGGGGGRF